MMARLAGFRVVALLTCFLALAACSKKTTPDLDGGAGQATPGSQQDFTLNVGDRVYFANDQSTLSEEARETLRRQAAWLNRFTRVTVQVTGGTFSGPRPPVPCR